MKQGLPVDKVKRKRLPEVFNKQKGEKHRFCLEREPD